MLADLFLCPASEMKRLDWTCSPLQKLGGPCEGVDFKNLTSLHFAILWARLEGAEWSPATHPFETVVQSRNYEDTATIEHFPQRMVTTFANAEEAAIADAARQLSGSPDFLRWETEELVWLMSEVRSLARRAAGRELCLWSAL